MARWGLLPTDRQRPVAKIPIKLGLCDQVTVGIAAMWYHPFDNSGEKI